ncbi:MAG: aldehyde dehydrogenase family protein, partial [Nocardiaceae bacterium]|nr:aldehyde dehydrogenase family protein [Nocardiaceae bacterium]
MTGLINASETSPQLQHPGKLFIGGEWVAPSTSARFDVVNPATEEVFLTVAEADAQDMARAVAAARHAFDRGPWPRMTHAERASYLHAIADGIRERSAELGTIWTSEMGILAAVSAHASAGSGDVFDYYAGLADSYEWVERHQPSSGRGVGLLVREPVGVVAAIIPWNSPLGLLANKVAAALIAGCTVVVKASPEAPGAVYAFAEIAEACGLPAGVVNVVTADREVSELLVRNPGIDKVTFTGSTAAG